MSATDLTSEKAELWAEVKRLRRDGQTAATIGLLERLCADHPGELRFLASLAEAFLADGRQDQARACLERARVLDPDDPRIAELFARVGGDDSRLAEEAAALKQARAELKRTLDHLAGDPETLISTYHAAVRERPELVADIENWAPAVNAAASAIYRANDERPGPWAQDVIREVYERGIAIRSFDKVIGDPELLSELQQVVRTTDDWTVPGKPHFFKAAREEALDASHPIVRGALHAPILEVANGFYGLYARLVSANIVQTRTDASPERKRRSSEGWHRDPEDTPMLKAFIYLNDVLELGHGPFQYVPWSRPGGKYAHLLERFGRGVYDRTYKTRPDGAEVDREVPPEDVVTVLGKAGTVFFCNTSGFHRGGFCTTQDRYMCAYVYQRPGSQYPSYMNPDIDVGDAPLAVRMAVRRP